MNWLHPLSAGLEMIVSLLKLLLESISVLCVAWGLITILNLAIAGSWRRSGAASSLNAVRLQFGTWLGMALEFRLGADIIGTTIAPSFRSLGELASLAGIRTFLNIFLRKELEAEARLTGKPPESTTPV